MWPEAPEVTPAPDGYVVAFTLPRGSFATSVLREITGDESGEGVTEDAAEAEVSA